MLALEMWHRLFADDDGSETAVDRSRRTSPAPWTCWRQRHESGALRARRWLQLHEQAQIVLFGPSWRPSACVDPRTDAACLDLARDFELLHFQVGSEGRRENALQKLMRFILSPLQLALFLLRTGTKSFM